MKIFVNKDIKSLFIEIFAFLAGFILLSQVIIGVLHEICAAAILVLSLISGSGILLICFHYFYRQYQIMEEAVSKIDAYLAGDTNARIDCDSEGELYKLFHSVNTLAAVLNAHTENAFRSKSFLKDTISDISHQLKTPLAALNIYNGLLQDETDHFSGSCNSCSIYQTDKKMNKTAENFSETNDSVENVSSCPLASLLKDIKEFASLSEQELDRMETLVQNLLKITKLDAGTIIIEKNAENVSDIMNDIEQYFAYRAKQEQKELLFSGADNIILFCDHDWIMEAISNIVKNAFDHTNAGNQILIEWKQMPDIVQITVKDNGCGIHSEDIYHIFKRFYRSRFSKDTQGLGLGLSLSKAIVELHNGSITADSTLGKGSIFTINFYNQRYNPPKS